MPCATFSDTPSWPHITVPEISLPRCTEAIATASEFVEREARSAGWGEPDLSRLVLAAIEAVSNAVEHGKGAVLVIRCDVGSELCHLAVSDGGSGPERSEVEAAELPPPDALGGRGLYILSQIADDLSVVDGVLRMTVQRPRAS